MQSIKQEVQNAINLKIEILEDEKLLGKIAQLSELFVGALLAGNKILFAGNGGSAADAQHLAAELVSRLEFDRPGLPAMSLSTDTSMITAIGNDYGYEKLFVRQLEAQSRRGDVFVGITTSGRSQNVLMAFDSCHRLGVTSVALCGLGGELDHRVNHLIRVPSRHTPRIQECHILIGHIICSIVEEKIFGHLRNVTSVQK
jgi:D-sedoheptulose 7-phosphate isomerase